MQNSNASPQLLRSPVFGIISMVLGILALIFSTVFGGFFGIPAIILGIIGIKKRSGKGMSIAGIVTGSLGLILTMLFLASTLLLILAVPALKTNQADTQRKSDSGYFMSAVTTYQSEHAGALPPAYDVDNFVTNYVKNGNIFKDSTTAGDYVFVDGTPSTLGEMSYRTGATCNDQLDGVVPAAETKAAVLVKLSTGVYCTNN